MCGQGKYCRISATKAAAKIGQQTAYALSHMGVTTPYIRQSPNGFSSDPHRGVKRQKKYSRQTTDA